MKKIKCCEKGPNDHVYNPSFSSELNKKPSKLECYITQGWKKLARVKHSSLVDPFVSNEENKVL
jgi:hypothetical protein